MKKIFIILAAAMLGVTSASADNLKQIVEAKGFDTKKVVATQSQIPQTKFRVNSPAVEAVKAEAPAKAEAILPGATLKDGATLENPQSINRATAAQAQELLDVNTPALAPKKATYPAATELSGDYIITYGPYFVNFNLERELCSDIKLTFKANNSVEIDGLFGVGKSTPKDNPNNLYNCKNITGTYNPETGEILVKPGQRFANMDVQYQYEDDNGNLQTATEKLALQIDWADLGDWSTFPPIIFKYVDGTFECQSDIMLQFYDTEEGLENTVWFMFDAGRRPILRKPNGSVNYAIWDAQNQKYNEYSKNVAYGFKTIDETEYMWVTNVASPNQGYITWWAVDGNTAVADHEEVYSYGQADENGQVNLRRYYLSYINDDYQEVPCMTADITNRQRVIFPTESNVWTAISPEGYYFGLYSQADITGTWVDPPKVQDYVSIYTPFYNNYDTNRLMTSVVTITWPEEGRVVIDGLGGITKTLAEADPAYTDIKSVEGTYNPSTKVITVPNGQEVATYNGKVLRLYGANLEAGEYYTSGYFTMTEEKGKWVVDGDLYVVGNGAGYVAQVAPVLAKAKGNVKYSGVDANSGYTIDEPIWFSFAERGGKEYLMLSNLAHRAGTGYITEWTMDEDGVATADHQVAYSFASPQGSHTYYLSTLESAAIDGTPMSTREHVMHAMVLDRNSIIIEAPRLYQFDYTVGEGEDQKTQTYQEIVYPRWAILAADGYQLGFNETAYINGYPTQEKAEDDPRPEKYIPETLNVIGELVDGAWNPATVAALNKEGDTFSGQVFFAGPYFSLCETQGVAGDWTSIGRRWGAVSNDYALTESTPAAIVIDNNDNAFKITTTLGFPLYANVFVDFNDMTVTINGLTSGIEDVSTENVAPVYYNLQGIRVENPVAGGIYIVRQGNKVYKVVK